MVQPATAPSRDSSFGRLFAALLDNVERVIQGKREQVHLALVCLLAEGHLLIEDVPGVGKTSLAKAIARSIGGTCHRIQFTPDLLPSDVTGVSVWNRASQRVRVPPRRRLRQRRARRRDQPGVARRRSRRCSRRWRSARSPSTRTPTALPRPFMVIATQNPIELEGTYPLPEAQLDRFLMRIPMGYPSATPSSRSSSRRATRRASGRRARRRSPARSTSPTPPAAVGAVHVAPEVRDYILDLVAATRRHPDLVLGASPRGVARAASAPPRALAAELRSRDYVIPDDVKRVAPVGARAPRDRSRPTPSCAASSARDVVRSIMASVPVPGATAAEPRTWPPRARPTGPSTTPRSRSPGAAGRCSGAACGLVVGSFLLGALEMLVLGIAALVLVVGVALWLRLQTAARARGEPPGAPRPPARRLRGPDRPRWSRTWAAAPPPCSPPPTGSTRAGVRRGSSCPPLAPGGDRRAPRTGSRPVDAAATGSVRSRSRSPIRSVSRAAVSRARARPSSSCARACTRSSRRSRSGAASAPSTRRRRRAWS